MDQSRFDAIARALADSASRRSALAALAGLAAGAAQGRATGRKRRRCRKDSPPGQCCTTKGGTVSCTCRNGGTPCGDACCAAGERCAQGACAPVPPEPACIALGEPCKGVGRRCCDGLGCGSGQGGLDDVACYAQAGDPCRRTADCAYGTECTDGICELLPPCRPGQALCGKTCRNLDNDSLACGACGAACSIHQTCDGGRCACGDLDGRFENATCCPGGTTMILVVADGFRCTPATEVTDCYRGYRCCAGRCAPETVSCAPCSADSECTTPGELCCDGRCKRASCADPGCNPVCAPNWAYALTERCAVIIGEPCPEGSTPCEGKNSDTAPNQQTFDDAPGWVCCPRGTTCDRQRGVCLQG